MDEGLGALAIIGGVIFLIVMVVSAILTLLAWTYMFLAMVLGHPLIVAMMLGVVGAAIGIARRRRRHGAFAVQSSRDLVAIGALKMDPEGWAVMVLLAFAGVVGLYGAFLI